MPLTPESVLGATVRDSITGVSGIAIAITYWIYGCARVVVQPAEVKDGKPVDASSFDAPQLEMMKPPPAVEPMNEGQVSPPGGPRPEPERRPDPVR